MSDMYEKNSKIRENFNPDNIPSELKAIKQWVMWKISPEGKKPPYPATEPGKFTRRASSKMPRDWVSFDDAIKLFKANESYSGLSFVLTSNDPYCVIDLDPTDDPVLIERNKRIMNATPPHTYAEISPSGKGSHIWLKGSVPNGLNKNGAEIYCTAKVMTMTGNIIDGRTTHIMPANGCEMKIFRDLGGNDNSLYFDSDDPRLIKPAVNDFATVYKRAMSDPVFVELFNRQPEQYKHVNESKDDFKFFKQMRNHTENIDQMRQLFEMSSRKNREKGDRENYVSTTIKSALLEKLTRSFVHGPLPFDTKTMTINGVLPSVMAKQHPAPAVIPEKKKVPMATAPEFLQQPDVTPVANGGPVFTKVHGVDSVQPPPGPLGDGIAEYIYGISPRPMAEIAISASLGLAAGIVGRAVNTPSDMGLNLIIAMTAPSNYGKDAASAGITSLLNLAADYTADGYIPNDEIKKINSTGKYKSGPAFRRALSINPSNVVVMGEFGRLFEEMGDSRSQHSSGLLTAIPWIHGANQEKMDIWERKKQRILKIP